MSNSISAYPRRSISALYVSPIEEDRRSLERIFKRTNWQLYTEAGLSPALALLRQVPVSVVLCEADLKPGCWRDMLRELSTRPVPQPLIVTTHLADDALWGEVLNLGGHDLVAKPFDQSEVVRVLSLAWLHWNHQQKIAPKAPVRDSHTTVLQRSAVVGAA